MNVIHFFLVSFFANTVAFQSSIVTHESNSKWTDDVVVVLTTGSYHQNCSAESAEISCPPDRIDLISAALNPTNGWLRGMKHIVISNHPWPLLGVRGIHEIPLLHYHHKTERNHNHNNDIVSKSNFQKPNRKLSRRSNNNGNKKVSVLKEVSIKSIMIAGVLLANQTYGIKQGDTNGGYKWIIGGDDDTYIVISQLIPYLKTLNHTIPLFLGVPGPALHGRWYCKNQSIMNLNSNQSLDSHRGPVCCLNTSLPCPVEHVNLTPDNDDDDFFIGFRYDFTTNKNISLDPYSSSNSSLSSSFNSFNMMNKKSMSSKIDMNSLSASSLLIRPKLCSPSICCGSGGSFQPKLVRDAHSRIPDLETFQGKQDSNFGYKIASQLHWPAGHYAYGGGGFILSIGMLLKTSRKTWEKCLIATRACYHIPADVALSTCIFNLGYTLTAAPPYILPPTSGERKGPHSKPNTLPGSQYYLQYSQLPGTWSTTVLHHIHARDVEFISKFENSLLLDNELSSLESLPFSSTSSHSPNSTSYARQVYWDMISEKCLCNATLGETPQKLITSGRGCLVSNCGLDLDPHLHQTNCCRCGETQWRAVFSPPCEWLMVDVGQQQQDSSVKNNNGEKQIRNRGI